MHSRFRWWVPDLFRRRRRHLAADPPPAGADLRLSDARSTRDRDRPRAVSCRAARQPDGGDPHGRGNRLLVSSARLVDRRAPAGRTGRRRCCDGYVSSRQPRDYADAILNVCKLYVESPLACVAGVTGSNLERRIDDIMIERTGANLTSARKAAAVVGGGDRRALAPLVIGSITAPLRLERRRSGDGPRFGGVDQAMRPGVAAGGWWQERRPRAQSVPGSPRYRLHERRAARKRRLYQQR